LPTDYEHIEQFQPWHHSTTATSRYLRILQDLSNEDKHRSIHIISVCLTSWGNLATGERFMAGFPFFPSSDGRRIEFITDLPPDRLFPPITDVASVGMPVYFNDPLTLNPTDIVRIPITSVGPNPRLEFFMPRLRVMYTTRRYNELCSDPTILWLTQAADEVINAVKPLLEQRRSA
jgi:hypothetical protein